MFDKALDVVNSAMYVVVGLAVFGFMWGVIKLLFSGDNQIAKKEGRDFMMYGILTLFVMTSVWGLVNLLNGTIKVDENVDYIGDMNTEYDSSVGDPTNNTFDNIKDAQDQNQGPQDFDPNATPSEEQRQV